MTLEQSFMPLLIAFAWLSGMLLLGALLRAKVKLFQKFLVPASIIGGILGFVLMSLGWTKVPHEAFSLIAFHLFGLGFVSIGLTGTDNTSKGVGKTVLKGSIWMALLFTASLCLQSLLGVGIIYGLNAFMEPIYQGLGLLVGHGYTQGPGQTLAIAAVWEKNFHVQDAMSIGLTFAAVGFFVAAFVGVPLANWGVRKGFAANAPKDLPYDFLKGILEKGSTESAGRLTTHSATIDGLAFHVALVGFVYGLAYLLCYFLKYNVLSGPWAELTFGMIFFYGLLVALLVRVVMNKLGVIHLINNDIQRRVTGTTVDYLLVATMMAVQMTVVTKYIVMLSLVCILAALLTTFLILYFGRRVGEYGFERAMMMFGYCTGTAASGLLLLRIVDPEFKSPVAMEAGVMNLFCVFTATHVVFMAGAVAAPTKSLPMLLIVEAVTAVVCLALIKVFRLWGKRTF